MAHSISVPYQKQMEIVREVLIGDQPQYFSLEFWKSEY